MMARLKQRIVLFFEKSWYQPSVISYVLLPFAWIYRLLIYLRRAYYRLSAHFTRKRLSIPLIVVGNLTVGGTGKTPVVTALALWLAKIGFKPGIILRGYGAKAQDYPRLVAVNDVVTEVGDEALMMARQTGLPVVIDPQRLRSAQYLQQKKNCNIIVSDDGLQHYALSRDIEIVLIDQQRQLGNGHCLPSGPLREPASRLKSVDYILYKTTAASAESNGFHYQADHLTQLVTRRREAPLGNDDEVVHAVCGIGHAESFFLLLESLGWHVIRHALPDHHVFNASDFTFTDNRRIIITEKDAVKCQHLADARFWVLRIKAVLPVAFKESLLSDLGF